MTINLNRRRPDEQEIAAKRLRVTQESDSSEEMNSCSSSSSGSGDNKKKAPIRSEWEETEKDLHISVDIGGVEEDDIELTTSEKIISVILKDGRKWVCRLLHEVVSEQTKCVVGKDKIVLVCIKQKSGIIWGTLGHISTINKDRSLLKKLDHVKNTFYDKQDTIHFVVIVNNLLNVDVEFEASGFTYYFSTRDSKFLDMYPSSTKDTVFYRVITTKYPIVPKACSFRASKRAQNKLEIKLKKVTNQKWTAVEAPSHSEGMPSSPVKLNSWQSLGNNSAESDEKTSVTATQIDEDMNKEKMDKSEKEQINEEHSRTQAKPTCVVAPLKPCTTNGGLTGLDNLGNTCFMNSIIQVLVNSTAFRNFFLDSSFQKDLNLSNPLGSEGKLAVAFAVLTRTLWDGKRHSFAPSKLKNLVSHKATQFTGFAQHDAQEFLAFLLDGLHEDLNRVKDKPYVDHTSQENLSDEEAAKQSWQWYKMRNDSFIVDEFQGQYKSKLVCPKCNNVSITFDPYMYVSVPLPKKKMRLFLYFFSKDPARLPVKYALNLHKDSTTTEVKKEMFKLTGVKSSNLRIFEVYKRKFHKFYDNNSVFSDNALNDTIFVFEVLSEEQAGEEVIELYAIQRALVPTTSPSRCSSCHKDAATHDVKLKRCTKCYKAGYCDSECQKAHWPTHKIYCKGTPENIGLPYMISLPRSQATYKNIADAMELYARYSVNTFMPPLKSAGIHDVTDNSVDSTSSGTSSPLSPGQDLYTYSSDSGESSPHSFYIKPVNKSGEGITEKPLGNRLEDKGDQVLELPGKFYVAMDWKNREKIDPYLLVESKDMDFDEHVSCEVMHQEENDLTLQKCLTLFTEPEVLSPEEAWYCPKCKEHTEATKQMSLWSLPDTLIIQLKRFSFRHSYHSFRDKIDKLVTFPISGLDLSKFHCEASTDVPPLYDLYGVVNHHGGLLGGHYTSYCRCLDPVDNSNVEQDWRLMDDSYVSYVSNERCVVNKAAYVLFYKRRNPSAAFLPPTVTANESDSSTSSDTPYGTPPMYATESQEPENPLSHIPEEEPSSPCLVIPEDDRSDADSNMAEPASPPSLDIDHDYDHFSGEDKSQCGSQTSLGYTDMDDID